jgi:hypothetical protein
MPDNEQTTSSPAPNRKAAGSSGSGALGAVLRRQRPLGGISAVECERLRTRAEVFDYLSQLFERMRPFAHRYILSASCNTPYTAPWTTLLDSRDAWREHVTL